MTRNKFEKMTHFNRPCVKLGYNGIAYEIERLAQRGLLAGKSLAEPRHQDVDTS